MRDRGTTRKERMLLAIGIVVVAVWFGLYAWFAEYLQLFTSPAPSFSIGFGTAMALVPSVVMILLVGFAIQITHKRPRVLFASFVVFQVASVTLSLVVQTAYINSLSPIPNFQDYIQVIGSLSLALAITSVVATLLLLLLALPARRPVVPPADFTGYLVGKPLSTAPPMNGAGWSWKEWGLTLTIGLSLIVFVLGEAASSYVACEVPAFALSACLAGYPYREIGLRAVIFGGIMFVVGIVLLAMWAQARSDRAPAPT